MGLADVKIDNFTNREVNAMIMINRLSAIVISLSPISNTGWEMTYLEQNQ